MKISASLLCRRGGYEGGGAQGARAPQSPKYFLQT